MQIFTAIKIYLSLNIGCTIDFRSFFIYFNHFFTNILLKYVKLLSLRTGYIDTSM